MKKENVLGISRTLFDELGSFQGFSSKSEYLDEFLKENNFSFKCRSVCEDDPSFKQIIPYCILKCRDRYLVYTRGGAGGEKRLNAKMSIGIGGHVNTNDFPVSFKEENGMVCFKSPLERYNDAVNRELNEELQIDCKWEQNVIGLINDDSNDVGRVHLGVVHLFELENMDVKSNEAAIADIQFLTLAELAARRGELETWSQIVVDYLNV